MNTSKTPRISARSGSSDATQHFWLQRLTALGNLILFIFFMITAIRLSGADFSEARAIVAEPFSAVMLTLLVSSVCYHMQLGMQVIIEDYIHGELLKLLVVIGNVFFCFGAGAVAIFAILKIAIGG